MAVGLPPYPTAHLTPVTSNSFSRRFSEAELRSYPVTLDGFEQDWNAWQEGGQVAKLSAFHIIVVNAASPFRSFAQVVHVLFVAKHTCSSIPQIGPIFSPNKWRSLKG